jgi:hypothetical protein
MKHKRYYQQRNTLQRQTNNYVKHSSNYVKKTDPQSLIFALSKYRSYENNLQNAGTSSADGLFNCMLR